MNITIFFTLFCFAIGCSPAAKSTKVGIKIPVSDSLYTSTEVMTPAWYGIKNRIKIPFKNETGYYTFEVDTYLSTGGHTITFPQDSVPAGGIKLLAIPYEDIPLDQYPNYKNFSKMRVILLNESNDTFQVRPQDGSLIMIQEAVDTDGSWKPVEYWQYSGCGNSYMSGENIAPGNFISVNAPRFKGSFKTQLRFKFKTYGSSNGKNGIFYSNSFEGSVNPGQFKKPDNPGMLDFLN